METKILMNILRENKFELVHDKTKYAVPEITLKMIEDCFNYTLDRSMFVLLHFIKTKNCPMTLKILTIVLFAIVVGSEIFSTDLRYEDVIINGKPTKLINISCSD